MNRQAFRSLAQRTRPALEQDFIATSPYTPTLGPLANYFRSFSSTTPARADDAGGAPSSTPTGTSGNNNASSRGGRGGRGGSALRARSVAAARGVGALTRGRGGFKPRGGGGGAGSPTGAAGAAGGAGEGQKILDVKILPRGRGGLRGRGGFRGRGGAAGAGASAGNRFSGAPGSPRGRGGQRGRGANARGGRGRGRGGKKMEGKDGEQQQKPKRPTRLDGYDFEHETEEMKTFDEAMRFGEETVYTPTTSLKEDLAPFMPAVPSGSGSAANAASVMKNLAILGTGDRIGHPDVLPASHYGNFLTTHGMRFFASTEQRAVAEEYLQSQRGEGKQGQIIKDAEESVKKVVLADAVQGKYEKPVFGEDPMSVVRSWGLREGSYGVEGRRRLEEKIGSLLAKGPKPKVQPKPKRVN